MTRSEKKAKDLVYGFYKIIGLDGYSYDCEPIGVIDKGLHRIAQLMSKECALRCVKEIIKAVGTGFNVVNENGDILGDITKIPYWEEVKQEIKKLKKLK